MHHSTYAFVMLAAIVPLACSGADVGDTASLNDASNKFDGQSDGVVATTTQTLITPPPVVVNFDTDASGATLTDGSIVDASYSSFGISLTCVVCASSHAYARAPGRSGNGVSLFPAPNVPVYDARYGAVRANFATPASSVSIDALPVVSPEGLGTPQSRPWIEAYDVNNALIARSYFPAYSGSGWASWQTLTVTAPAGTSIKYVQFSSQHVSGPPVYAAFDNLTFNAAPLDLNDGMVVREISSAPVYVIVGGARLWITTPSELQTYFGGWSAVQVIADHTATLLPTVPRDGTVVREASSAPVYLMQSGQKRWITSPTVLQRYGGWAVVNIVPNGSLTGIPTGPQIN